MAELCHLSLGLGHLERISANLGRLPQAPWQRSDFSRQRWLPDTVNNLIMERSYDEDEQHGGALIDRTASIQEHMTMESALVHELFGVALEAGVQRVRGLLP